MLIAEGIIRARGGDREHVYIAIADLAYITHL